MNCRAPTSFEKACSGALGALRWAVLQRDKENAGAMHLLIMMACKANQSFECFMSVANMAEAVGRHERTVQHKIKRLQLLGFISDISDRYPHRRTKTYRLNAQVVTYS